MNDDKLQEIRDRISGASHPDGVRLPPTPEQVEWLIVILEKTRGMSGKLAVALAESASELAKRVLEDVKRVVGETKP